MVRFRSTRRWRPAAVALATGAARALSGAGAVAFAAGEAPGAPGGGSSWSTGDKTAMGTATSSASTAWFTAAAGITTEVSYPRADVQDMQYVVAGALSRSPRRRRRW